MKYLSNNTIRHQLKKEFNIVIKSLEEYDEVKDQSQLHNLRVSLKKIKAISAIIDKANKNTSLKNNSIKLNDLFKEVGAIRSVFINLTIYKKYFPSEINLLSFQLEINELSNKLLKNKKKHLSIIKNVKNNTLNKNIKCEIKKIIKVVSQLLNKITICTYFIPYDYKILHDIRKQLKLLIYILNGFRTELYKYLKLNYNYLNELQEIIGNWHDIELARILIRKKFTENKKINKKITFESEKQLIHVKKKLALFEKQIRIQQH